MAREILFRPGEDMRVKLRVAGAEDVEDLVFLRNAAAENLTAKFGHGHWLGKVTEKGVLFSMRMTTVYVARDRGKAIATLALSTRKPWAIDKKYFHASTRPLYLTNMAVEPARQGKGIGRLCIAEAIGIARNWPSDALRLDAYDARAGAGEFYRKCGFDEVGGASYRGAPLIYFQLLI